MAEVRKKIKSKNDNVSVNEKEVDIEQTYPFYIKSRPNISQVAYYGEMGFDWMCKYFLIQPFIGFEADRFKRTRKTDHANLSSARLIYSKKEVTNAYSR